MGLFDKIFPKRVIYAVISSNKLSLLDVESGTMVDRIAVENFSAKGQLIAHFKVAEGFIRKVTKELLEGSGQNGKSIKVVLQIAESEKMEKVVTERQILIDVFEHAGATKVYLLEHQTKLSNSEILALINR